MRVGIYPGTFDPVTLGHMDIIKKAISIVDKLIIAVASDTRKSTYFTASKRAEFLKISLKGAIREKAQVVIFSGLLIKFVEEQKSNLIIRGLRAVSDFEYEFQMSWINHQLNSEIQTIFLPASKDNQFISSSFIKQILNLGGDVSKFIAPEVLGSIKQSS